MAHSTETLQEAALSNTIANMEKLDTLKKGSRSAPVPIGKISQKEAAKRP
jgi:hypothetical protein